MSFLISSWESKLKAIAEIKDCSIEDNLYFSLEKYTGKRRSAQNRLMWDIYGCMERTDINEHAGTTKDEWHYFFKKEFLVNIYERDAHLDNGNYASLIQSVRHVYKLGMKDIAEKQHEHIVKETSTTKATVGQFSEYLGEIMRWCNHRGITYRLRQDVYQKAMIEVKK